MSTTKALSRPYSAISDGSALSRPYSAVSLPSAIAASRPHSALPRGKPGANESTHKDSLARQTSWQTTSAASLRSSGSAYRAGDAVLSDIVQVGGPLWLGPLVSLMRSVNKWPVSLDLPAVSASVCAKACALVQAASAALFLVDAEKEELALVHSPALAAGRPTPQRVPIGHGLVGGAAASRAPVRCEAAAAAPEYSAETDALANKQGDAGAPASVLCVPLLDDAGEAVAVLQVVNKRDGRVFQPEDEAMLTLLGMQARPPPRTLLHPLTPSSRVYL